MTFDNSIGDLRIRRVAGHIGGEVQGLRLDGDLPDGLVEQLNTALVKHPRAAVARTPGIPTSLSSMHFRRYRFCAA